jgi:aspartate kinase
MPTGIDTISVVISDCQLNNKLDQVLASIRSELGPDSIEVHPNMALIATVGQGMARTPGIAAKLFSALANAGVNVRMIDQGSSEINIIVGVETGDFETAVRAIYDAFVR